LYFVLEIDAVNFNWHKMCHFLVVDYHTLVHSWWKILHSEKLFEASRVSPSVNSHDYKLYLIRMKEEASWWLLGITINITTGQGTEMLYIFVKSQISVFIEIVFCEEKGTVHQSLWILEL
jgi:hypothetical protein